MEPIVSAQRRSSSWPGSLAMLPEARLVAPRMRKGAILVSDNVGAFWIDHHDYLAWLRGPESGFQSALIALNEGTEISVKS